MICVNQYSVMFIVYSCCNIACANIYSQREQHHFAIITTFIFDFDYSKLTVLKTNAIQVLPSYTCTSKPSLELYHVTFTYVVIGWLVMLNDISSDIICNNSTHVLLILLLDFVDNAQLTWYVLWCCQPFVTETFTLSKAKP